MYIKKIMDIGTEEPFVARLFSGLMDLRDFSLQQRMKSHEIDNVRRNFDKLYEPVLNALIQVFESARRIRELIYKHIKDLNDGKIVDFQNIGFQINDCIDRELRDDTAKFLINSTIAIKTHQKLLLFMGVDIGFFSKNLIILIKE